MADNRTYVERLDDRLKGVEARLERLEARKPSDSGRQYLWQIVTSTSWEEYRRDAEGSFYCGQPVKYMGRDELLYIIGRQIETLRQHGLQL